MAELLPYGKYTRQTQRTRWLASESFKVLHMASLEEAREEKEKPDTIGNRK
jgi:hypothetical protein